MSIEKQKIKLFKSLKKIIVECETNIHNDPSFRNEQTEKSLKQHKEYIKRLQHCSNTFELFDIMDGVFGMSVTDVIETYM